MPDFIMATQLAAELGFSSAYIRSEINKGRLTGIKLGRNWGVVLDAKYNSWRDNPRRGEMSDVVKEAKKRKTKTKP